MVGADVSALRQRWGLTQQQLADRAGVNRTTVYRWERSDTPLRRRVELALQQIERDLADEKRRQPEES